MPDEVGVPDPFQYMHPVLKKRTMATGTGMIARAPAFCAMCRNRAT
ncbi:hypothetical protein ACFOHS_00215 [Jhaorihella thermophila]